MRSHRDLDAWKESMRLVEAVYRLTEQYPDAERYGLVSQTRRAAVSIAANIAEGAARHSPREFRHFLYASLGSASELETLLELAVRTGQTVRGAVRPVYRRLKTVSRMLMGLIRWLNRCAGP